MTVLQTVVAVGVSMFIASAGQAYTVNTNINRDAQTVRIDFTDLPLYEQIRLEGVTGLFGVSGNDPHNPSSLESTGFTVNGDNLEMEYGGGSPPANYIIYHYIDGYDFTGWEESPKPEWIVVTESGGDELMIADRRPILVPEPGADLLFYVALVGVAAMRRSARCA